MSPTEQSDLAKLDELTAHRKLAVGLDRALRPLAALDDAKTRRLQEIVNYFGAVSVIERAACAELVRPVFGESDAGYFKACQDHESAIRARTE